MAKQMTESQPANTAEPVLIDVKAVAKLLGCSTRHVTRLQDAGQMPPAMKLGRLSRWHRETILAWIAAGCPDRLTWEKSRKGKQ
ncbi:MAG: helix-turn-helix domain-containing protein [Planctomycetia bacterium]|nr:helix-turn-helix domain-containing protein [Planctomycetia bacterium]